MNSSGDNSASSEARGGNSRSGLRNQLLKRNLGLGYVRVNTFSHAWAICRDHIVIICVSKLDEIIDAIRRGDRLLIDLTERFGGLITAIYVVADYTWRIAGIPGKKDTMRLWPRVAFGRLLRRATRRFFGGLRGLRYSRLSLLAR